MTISSTISRLNYSSIPENWTYCSSAVLKRKPVRSNVVEEVDTSIVEQSIDNVVDCISACAVLRQLGVAYSTVWNVHRKMVHCLLYKISEVTGRID